MDERTDPAGSDPAKSLDPASLGLAIFFVILIAIVIAMLVLPAFY